ncbi:hypothetical protein [Streptomyces tsukubensis]|uniref:Uncharacterized protein n=1 Tax=Streptomyces tsukubensis TaxID=83656 RepID=A0A1V4A7J3_9ACTN|nr:hypothetical protein [Streptomyces tsukubensis]OON78361.1 hypothetical protein B1H18_16320 [Streptomyces tsukubensis]QFR95121.1 hypothetical protein GBW32_21480 [Streptomyces tsukubensis]
MTPETGSAPASAPPTGGADPAEARRVADAAYAREQRNLAEEKKNERYLWWYLGYFLFGIHAVAFVMILAIKHANP